jgi:hypothetical protein
MLSAKITEEDEEDVLRELEELQQQEVGLKVCDVARVHVLIISPI